MRGRRSTHGDDTAVLLAGVRTAQQHRVFIATAADSSWLTHVCTQVGRHTVLVPDARYRVPPASLSKLLYTETMNFFTLLPLV